MTLLVVTFTHTDYKYLWPLINDAHNQLKGLDIYTVFFCDKKEVDYYPSNFDKIFKYDDTINYTKRMSSLLDNFKNEYDYVLVIHDIDIIINFNKESFKKYFSLMTLNKIDRLSLGIYCSSETIDYDNDIKIGKLLPTLKSHLYVPYDVTPSIWLIKSFQYLCVTFDKETYASSEQNKDWQHICETKLNCYGIQFTNSIKIQYCRGIPYSTMFKFLHITTSGKFVYPLEIYQDTYQDLLHILEKYKISIEKIGHYEQQNTYLDCKNRPYVLTL